jgi:phage FluMu protein Com
VKPAVIECEHCGDMMFLNDEKRRRQWIEIQCPHCDWWQEGRHQAELEGRIFRKGNKCSKDWKEELRRVFAGV